MRYNNRVYPAATSETRTLLYQIHSGETAGLPAAVHRHHNIYYEQNETTAHSDSCCDSPAGRLLSSVIQVEEVRDHGWVVP